MTIIVQTTASASSRDYAWLLDAIAKWNGNRTDLAALAPDFVMLAEKRLNADLEARAQESVVTLQAPAGAKSITIPEDMAEMKSLSSAAIGPLDYLPPDPFNAQVVKGESGNPRYFCVIGDGLYLYPFPDSDVSLECSYRAYVPALADSAGTNWLIRQHPDAYLAASMCEALVYTKNMQELPVWEQKYQQAIENVNKPDWFSGSSLAVRTA